MWLCIFLYILNDHLALELTAFLTYFRLLPLVTYTHLTVSMFLIFIHLQMYWLKETDRPQTALGALKACDKSLFPNIYTILHVLVVFPVTSAEAERSFSSLKRLKTRLRSTMGEERLNGLAMMTIHRDVDVDIKKVIQKFAVAHPRKMRLAFVLDDPQDDN